MISGDGQTVSSATRLVRLLAAEWADMEIDRSIVPDLAGSLGLPSTRIEQVRSGLLTPMGSLRVLLGAYAFGRRGKERSPPSDHVLSALKAIVAEGFDREFIEGREPGLLWDRYTQSCAASEVDPGEPANRRLVEGLASLAQETFHSCGESIATWIAEEARRTGRVEPAFERLSEIRGLGPKAVTLFLRDLSLVLDFEEATAPVDRIYFQPIGRWTRMLAPHVVEEPNMEAAPDWVLAGKLARACRLAGVLGARFSAGVTAFCKRRARTSDELEAALSALLRGDEPGVRQDQALQR